MEAFDWLDRQAPDHALAHAKADMLTWFDKLPPEIQYALNQAQVNVCAWCASIWCDSYGPATALALIYNTTFVDDTRAVTCACGWGGRL